MDKLNALQKYLCEKFLGAYGWPKNEKISSLVQESDQTYTFSFKKQLYKHDAEKPQEALEATVTEKLTPLGLSPSKIDFSPFQLLNNGRDWYSHSTTQVTIYGLQLDDLFKRKQAAEEEFQEKWEQKVPQEILDKVDEAKKAMAEAVKLSEELEVSFPITFGFVSNCYHPKSLVEKFILLESEFIKEQIGDSYLRDGWEHSGGYSC